MLFEVFYSGGMPTILCEGETDNVYLSAAIHRLAASYPELAVSVDPNKLKLNVRLYKYSNTVNKRILQLAGGTGDLHNFIVEYHRQVTTKFKSPAPRHPVVMLIDHDSGKDKVFDAIKKVTKKPIDESLPFTHLFSNLYLVLTPTVAPAVESCIEDCFDEATHKLTYEGKPFNPSNKKDQSAHYGKTVFAHKVVRPNADTIDFNGFRPLLDRLQGAIDHYKKLMIP